MNSALVIGAGIGGIAIAARLARLGYRVTVVEKGDRAGGRCDRLVRDGHCFDTGPTLFLMSELFAQAFDELGECMEDHLDLRRVDPSYRIHFDDGSNLALTSDLGVMQTQMEAIEPGSFGGLLRYLNEGHLHYELVLSHIVGRNFFNLFEYFSPKNVGLIFRLKALAKHYANVGKYFSDDRLKIAFTFQDMYVGLSPYTAPATYSMLQYAELAGGVWFPMGGMYRIVQALTSIAEKSGAQFVYNAPVEQINVNGRQATGVTLADGRQIQADIVVANADLPYVYRCLLPDDGASRRLERKKYTCSTVTFCWGVDKQYPQLGAHNLFIARDFRQCIDQIFQDLTLPDDPSIYVHAPVRIDPSMAPNGQDTLTAVVPVGHINDAAPQDWPAIQKRARRLVLQRLAQIGVSDLEDHIKFEISHTPSDWQSRYNLTKGAGYGLSHTFLQMGYLRPHNRHARYRNVYFVGASTHPGAGLPTVLISARLTTERILRDAGTPQPA
ncbi:MAG: phytoene desaturase [Chloroflexi bacterium]|nr:phytoene desaturase [Chloroflexota bacterium]